MNEQVKQIAETLGKEMAAAIKSVTEQFDGQLQGLRTELEAATKSREDMAKAITTISDALKSIPDHADDFKSVQEQISAALNASSEAKAHADSLFKSIEIPSLPEPVLVDVGAITQEVKETVATDVKSGLESIKQAVKTMFDELELQQPAEPVNGKDALELEVLPCIDVDKSYPRGTYASHDGGLFRAYQRTTGMKGWECIVNGVASLNIEHQEKAVTVSAVMADGTTKSHQITIPTPEYKGVFSEDGNYQRGDFTTYDGSVWVLEKDVSTEAPGKGDSWRLAVKRGERGQGLYAIARKHGFKGTEKELVDHIIKGEKPDTVVRL